MTRDEIQQILSNAAGNPDTGVVRDIIPGMAAALDRALNGEQSDEPAPTKAKEKRVLEVDETR